MEFRIADTFTDGLARLDGDAQKSVKVSVFDLQANPAHPSLMFHKLEKAKDKNFWSVRVGSDIRIIVHRSKSSLMLCYVDHHDRAYAWAERRKLEVHPATGAAQFVEIRERVEEIVVPVYVQTELAAEKPPVFRHLSDEELLMYGVPEEWLGDVREATEDTILAIAEHLPQEAAEALLELATGGTPSTRALAAAAAAPVVAETDAPFEDVETSLPAASFEHPDAQRRFRVIENVAELERALEFPWDKWSIFLHPDQRDIVKRDFNGPARVSGSAGTGKTIVALHRAVYLARKHTDSRVLLTTFSETLANALRTKLKRLVSHEPRLGERIEVHAIDAIGARLYRAYFGPPEIATRDTIRELIRDASAAVPDHKFSLQFLLTEWEEVVDASQLDAWESYRDFVRLGRKTRLPEKQRAVLWSIFERVRDALAERKLVTHAAMFTKLAGPVSVARHPPFDFAVVDEAQDISVSQLKFMAALGGSRPNSLFFAGDLGQRIFQLPFSWKALGVDIRGRSRTLRVNYRTSHQIRMQADRLLDPEVGDVDGNVDYRADTISVFNGPLPEIRTFDSQESESAAVADWLRERSSEGIAPHEIGVFVRSEAEIDRARGAVETAGLRLKVLDEHVETNSGYASIGTMHLAKGLEFRAVVVMACDDEVVPLQSRIDAVGDEADLQEVYDTERHLLYVACTRARDRLLVTAVEPASEFLDDLGLGAS